MLLAADADPVDVLAVVAVTVAAVLLVVDAVAAVLAAVLALLLLLVLVLVLVLVFAPVLVLAAALVPVLVPVSAPPLELALWLAESALVAVPDAPFPPPPPPHAAISKLVATAPATSADFSAGIRPGKISVLFFILLVRATDKTAGNWGMSAALSGAPRRGGGSETRPANTLDASNGRQGDVDSEFESVSPLMWRDRPTGIRKRNDWTT
jgi:hypothetical protein